MPVLPLALDERSYPVPKFACVVDSNHRVRNHRCYQDVGRPERADRRRPTRHTAPCSLMIVSRATAGATRPAYLTCRFGAIKFRKRNLREQAPPYRASKLLAL